MTSRERVLAAVRHQQPDRVPVDLGSTPSSGISARAYSRLKSYLGLREGSTRIYDVVQQLAQPEDIILDHFNIDVVDIGRAFNTAASDWSDTTMADGNPAQYPIWFIPEKQPDGSWLAYEKSGIAIAEMPEEGLFFDQNHFPYLNGYPSDYRDLPEAMSRVLWSAFAPSPWDRAGETDFWANLRENVIQLRQSTDRALLIGAGCNLFEWGTFLRRMDQFLMDLIAERYHVEALLDALLEIHLNTLEKICAAVGDVVDIIRFGDDLGMNSGPFMSPQIYRELFKPRHAQLTEYVKKNSRMVTFLHSCGSIYKLIPDLIDAGFEILNPVQTNSKDMEPERLKMEYGRDVTFWGGGADTRRVLNWATPEQVKTHVLKRLEIFSPGGGFVFNTIHNILPEVPPENVVAMFEAIESFNH